MKVLDWEVIKNGGKALVSKELVLYGASSGGDKMITYLRDLKMTQNLTAVFDSNPQKWGCIWNGYKICPPEELKEMSENLLIVVASDFITEIVRYLVEIEVPQETAVSGFCFRLALHLDIINDRASQFLDDSILADYKKKYACFSEISKRREIARMYRYQAAMQETMARFSECILINGVTKVGNTTLDLSFAKIPNAVWTRHCSYYGEENSLENLHGILEAFPNHRIHVLTGVRQPLERLISSMWQEIDIPFLFGEHPTLNTVWDNINTAGFTEHCIKERALSTEEWFHKHIELAFGIDVFSVPFDTEKGYTILSKGNVSVFVYRLDFLSSLEKEIGEFTHVKNFKLLRDNVADKKEYAFAYQDYLKEVKVKRKFFEGILNGAVMQHFYTEQERENYRKKWAAKLCD